MKVLFDYQAFFQEVGGVSRCFYELAKRLPEYIDIDILVKYSDNLYLQSNNNSGEILPVKVTAKSFLSPLKFKGRQRLYGLLENSFECFPTFTNANKRYAKQVLEKEEFDIYHCTLYDDFFIPYLNNRPFVVTVHDMIWEIFPSDHSPKNSESKKALCFKANHIIAVSECTKRDLIRLWNIDSDKISVVYHGAPMKQYDYGAPLFESSYLLYVGLRHGYKNFLQTLYDFAIFHQKHPEVSLICTGPSFSKEESILLHSLGINKCVYHMFVGDKELANLYHYALAFIYPSIYEGFGIPILEAFTYECITLLNNKSCFPEIGGDAALFFDSNLDGTSNLPEILERVYRMSEDERRAIIQRGCMRARKFTWEESAKKMYAVYQSL